MDTKDILSKRSIEALTAEVGSLTEPPPPEIPIPKQWLPRFIAKGIKSALLPFVLLDQSAKKIARLLIKPPFKRTGSCKKRGNCCYYVTMRKRTGLLDWFQKAWMTQVHNFYLRDNKNYLNGRHIYYLFGCSNLKKDGSCAEYRLRPSICRDWPLVEIFGYPKILKGCGYWFFAKKKEHQHVVEEYNAEYEEKKNPLRILNDAVFYESE